MKKSSDAPTAAEEELRQAELLLRAVLETAPGLIYAKDRAGRMLIANPPTLDLIGKPWALVKGRTDAELLDDRTQGEAIMANDRRVMDAGVAEVLEEVVGTEDGLTRIWLSTKAPLRDEAGAVIGLVGISQNITDRKQAERRLVELNETLEERVAERTAERDRAWRNSQDLLAVLDVAGNLKAVNSAWTQILGWTPEELIDHSCLEFIHPDYHDSTRGALVDASDAPLMYHYENRYRHRDGTYKWINWVAAPEGDRIYASGRHITAEKEAAAALEVKAAQLEASNKELESFTYSVSHDLRAPLRAIDGFGLMLEEDYGAVLDHEGRRLLSVMRDSSRRMGELIDDLLAFSRLSHAALNAAEVNVEVLVREVIGDLTHGGATRCEFDVGALAPAYGDRGLLRQAWVNLLSNAVKYSSTVERPRVEVRSRVDGDQTFYTIRDNGVGFDMQYAHKLFGVFQRLHAADEFAGTGVGLAIVQRIVARHGGRVWAESELKRGALFSFSLPTLS